MQNSLRENFPNNNSLLVVSSSSGGLLVAESNSLTQSTPVYMYVYSILVYVFASTSAYHVISKGQSALAGTGLSGHLLENLFKQYTLSKHVLIYTDSVRPFTC